MNNLKCHCERSAAIANCADQTCTVRDCFVVSPRNDIRGKSHVEPRRVPFDKLWVTGPRSK